MPTPTPSPTPTEPIPPPGQAADSSLERARILINDLNASLYQARGEAQAIRASLETPDEPPRIARPRDLSRIAAAIETARLHSEPYAQRATWASLNAAYESATEAITALTSSGPPPAADTRKDAAAALITALASRVIARASADLAAHLRSTSQIDGPAWGAVDDLTIDAENLADQAAGYLPPDSLRPAHTATLRTEMRALHKAIEEHRPTTSIAVQVPPLEPDPGLPALLSTVHALKSDAPEWQDLTDLTDSISEIVTAIRRRGEGWAADVRVHGWAQAFFIRAYEVLARIARHDVRRFDKQGRGDSGRRKSLATIHHQAEEHLERLRGTLPPGGRVRGFYDHTPDRYLDRLVNESRDITASLRESGLAPEKRAQLQIRLLLNEAAITKYTTASEPHAHADAGHVEPTPASLVGGAPPEPDPVTARRQLIDALRQRVDKALYGRHTQTLNSAADRLAREITGNPELSPAAREAPLAAADLTAAADLIASGTLPSPLVLAGTPELALTYAQADRALAALEILGVAGPIKGLEPRTATATPDQLPRLLHRLDERLPGLLAQTASATPSSPAPTNATSPEPLESWKLWEAAHHLLSQTASFDANALTTVPTLSEDDRRRAFTVLGDLGIVEPWPFRSGYFHTRMSIDAGLAALNEAGLVPVPGDEQTRTAALLVTKHQIAAPWLLTEHLEITEAQAELILRALERLDHIRRSPGNGWEVTRNASQTNDQALQKRMPQATLPQAPSIQPADPAPDHARGQLPRRPERQPPRLPQRFKSTDRPRIGSQAPAPSPQPLHQAPVPDNATYLRNRADQFRASARLEPSASTAAQLQARADKAERLAAIAETPRRTATPAQDQDPVNDLLAGFDEARLHIAAFAERLQADRRTREAAVDRPPYRKPRSIGAQHRQQHSSVAPTVTAAPVPPAP
ncbi:hypothetical protein [Streptomyces chartreusis]|uniref:hypothetical protein n=1 Tax=Streptomyces chartreusis TaxID=1969 RepID=UPI0034041B47